MSRSDSRAGETHVKRKIARCSCFLRLHLHSLPQLQATCLLSELMALVCRSVSKMRKVVVGFPPCRPWRAGLRFGCSFRTETWQPLTAYLGREKASCACDWRLVPKVCGQSDCREVVNLCQTRGGGGARANQISGRKSEHGKNHEGVTSRLSRPPRVWRGLKAETGTSGVHRLRNELHQLFTISSLVIQPATRIFGTSLFK